MRTTGRRQIGAVVVLAGLLGAAPAGAQDAPVVQVPPVAQAPVPEPVVFLSSNLVQGELLRVDVEAERFVVKEPNGSEMELLLDQRTTILGVDDIRELALRAGSRVSVKFSRDDGERVATSVRVHPKIETRQRRYPPL